MKKTGKDRNIKGGPKQRWYEWRSKTVTPLTDLLQKTGRGDKLSIWFSLSFWRRGKGAYRDGLVDTDTTGGIERREQ
jgi:hypothetical protein